MIHAANISLTESIDLPLKRTRWQGRLQRVMINGCSLWVDGAHNEAGAKALRETLGQLVDSPEPSDEPSKAWTFFLHIKVRKDAAAIMKHFASIANAFYIVDFPIEGGDSTSLAEMITIGKTLGVKTYPLTSFETMHHIMATTDGHFIATGSLFWVGAVLKQLSHDRAVSLRF
jgi:folylpolyglutamate synthase/dihydropteroate synthase